MGPTGYGVLHRNRVTFPASTEPCQTIQQRCGRSSTPEGTSHEWLVRGQGSQSENSC